VVYIRLFMEGCREGMDALGPMRGLVGRGENNRGVAVNGKRDSSVVEYRQ
jgi:hypothetical protein